MIASVISTSAALNFLVRKGKKQGKQNGMQPLLSNKRKHTGSSGNFFFFPGNEFLEEFM